MLLMLEDNAERVQRFMETLHAIDPGITLLVWRDAKTMIREVGPHLPAARVISLDHDLEPLDDGRDPGDGLDQQRLAIHTPSRERNSSVATPFAERLAQRPAHAGGEC